MTHHGEAPAPDGLEDAAVTHHHRRSGGVQMRVLDVDRDTREIVLGNIYGSVTYRWSERSDCHGFRFVERTPIASAEVAQQPSPK